MLSSMSILLIGGTSGEISGVTSMTGWRRGMCGVVTLFIKWRRRDVAGTSGLAKRLVVPTDGGDYSDEV